MGKPKSDFEAQLARLGWKKAELASRLNVHPNTVTGWASGKAPGPVLAYLRLAIGAKDLLQ